MGFRRFGRLNGKELIIETELPRAPGVYLATLDDEVFWVGQTDNLRTRFGQYRFWFALPDNSPRRDRPTRDSLLAMVGGHELVFHYKEPAAYFSTITEKSYPAHRIEEMVFIELFDPAWNNRPGGRKRG